MSLEDSILQNPNIGFQGIFKFSSDNPDVTAEFIGTSGIATLVLNTPSLEQPDVKQQFAIRADPDKIQFIHNDEPSILDLTDDGIFAHRDLYFKSLIPMINDDGEKATIGDEDNLLGNIFTEKIHIDGFTIFKQNNDLYKKNEKTGEISTLSSGQIFKWMSVEGHDDIVILEGNLIIDNTIHLKGNLYSNVDISQYKIRNDTISKLALGEGTVHSLKNSPSSHYTVINDAWKQFNDYGKTTMYSSKTVIVTGDLYLSCNIDYNPKITRIRNKEYSIEEIVHGTNNWSNLQDFLYTDNDVWINGDILVGSNVFTDYVHNEESNILSVPPLDTTHVETVNIKDRLVVHDHKTVVGDNEFVELTGQDVMLNADNIHLDGNVVYHRRNINVLKEIYEHSVVYNSMESMQKRSAFTGQIPIKEGYKHEIGYHVTWTAKASKNELFKVTGSMFMNDTIPVKNGGLRLDTSFTIVINPYDDGKDLPGLDQILELKEAYHVRHLKDDMDLIVERVSAKHIKIKLIWETIPAYKEDYIASLDLVTMVSSTIGNRMLFSPFHNVLEGALDTGRGAYRPYYANIPLQDVADAEHSNMLELTSNTSKFVSDIEIGGDTDKSSLIVQRYNMNSEAYVAEFWDKYGGYVPEDTYNDNKCIIEHFQPSPQGVVIGQAGVTAIGVNKNTAHITTLGSSAQLNVNSQFRNKNRIHINGGYGKESVFDNNGNLIIGNTQPYVERNNVNKPTVHEYSMDVTGDMMLNGSITVNHNEMIRAVFNMQQFKNTLSTSNVMEMYLSWGIEEEKVPDIVQNLRVNIAYNICSVNLVPPKIRSEDLNIVIDPRDNGIDTPKAVVQWSREGMSSSLYQDVNVTVKREDYNAVYIEVKSLCFQPVDTISYGIVTVAGDNRLQQFALQTKLDFYGVLDVKDVEDIDLILTTGSYELNLYDLYEIPDRHRAYFEIKNQSDESNIDIHFDNYNMLIHADARGIMYSFDIHVFNKRKYFMNSNLTINVTELYRPEPYLNDVYIDDYVVGSKEIDVFSMYNISDIYTRDYMYDYLYFDSRFSISTDGYMRIIGKLTGEEYHVNVSAYYLNIKGTEYVMMNNQLNIHYKEALEIRTAQQSPISITIPSDSNEIVLELLLYYNDLTVDIIQFETDVLDVLIDMNEFTLTLNRNNIGQTITILAYYIDNKDVSLNDDLKFIINE